MDCGKAWTLVLGFPFKCAKEFHFYGLNRVLSCIISYFLHIFWQEHSLRVTDL